MCRRKLLNIIQVMQRAPFNCLDLMSNYGEESEYLELSLPEGAAARAQVLDYFLQIKKVIPDV